MIRRRGVEPSEDEQSSSDEDAFSALSQKTKNMVGKKSDGSDRKAPPSSETSADLSHQNIPAKLPIANTSSMKRHHGASDIRRAKMEALLQYMQADKESVESGSGHYGPASSRDRFVPDKKGSFVEPGEEHLTTNIFVGNLDPTITEEEVTELFRQFGDLYSVKVMWPRTPEERARNRNTGFVCFMTREDAQEAMDAFNETDPFRVGRRLMMRWGKNVKKSVKRGTGGVAPIRKKSMDESSHQFSYDSGKRRKIEKQYDNISSMNIAQASGSVAQQQASIPTYDPNIHASSAIRVIAPSDPQRLKFINTVASFVSKDGTIFEQKLIENQSSNPDFDFLTLKNADERQRSEHFFYRWRVFAFCQGDGFDSWRTVPFVMVHPHGRFWIPPSLNREAAWREEQAAMEKEDQIRQRQEQRRRVAERKDFMTGRQLEQAKFGRAVAGASDGGATLTADELEEFEILVKKNLCASREAICEAMAFCYGKSGAAKQISSLLREVLLDDSYGISVDTRIARLFLMSDVLFNSQQPGVRNAFLYRSAIEDMAPDVFSSLGCHGKGRLGRMTLNKLKTAVSAVLSAWTNWSVYNPTFLDELHDRFEGREVVPPKEESEEDEDALGSEPPQSTDEGSDADVAVITDKPRGDWTEVTTDHHGEHGEGVDDKLTTNDGDENGEAITDDTDVDGEPITDDDVDGAQLEEGDIDDECLDDVDGEPIADEEVDGEALVDDDIVSD